MNTLKRLTVVLSSLTILWVSGGDTGVSGGETPASYCVWPFPDPLPPSLQDACDTLGTYNQTYGEQQCRGQCSNYPDDPESVYECVDTVACESYYDPFEWPLTCMHVCKEHPDPCEDETGTPCICDAFGECFEGGGGGS